uniref:Uncharacterized protein n=1 Tax=Sphaerodactylus townsendi TaxID=933632 RepID=A0ACB8FNE0_9SAUR
MTPEFDDEVVFESTGVRPKGTRLSAPRDSMEFALPATGDASKGIVDLTQGSRVRLLFAEDTRDRDLSVSDEARGAAAFPEGDLEQPPEPDLFRWAEQFEALEAAKRDWEQEREALETEREALETEREALEKEHKRQRQKFGD